MTLQQQGSVITKAQTDIPGLGCCPDMLMSKSWAELIPPLHLGIVGELALRASSRKLTPPLGSCSTHSVNQCVEGRPHTLQDLLVSQSYYLFPVQWCGQGKDTISLTPHHLQQMGDLALGS